MSQKPLMESGTRSPKTPGLKPALAAALGSLEVHLDQELARYRRSRMGVRANSQPSVQSYVISPPEAKAKTPTINYPQPPIIEVFNYTTPVSVPEPPATPSIAPETPTPALEPVPTESHTQIPLPLPKVSSSLVPSPHQTDQHDKLLADDTPSQPNDYLESSEALLRSLTDEQPEENSANHPNDSLLSPLGIGSILLLILASLMLGYVVLNPQSLPQFNLSKIFNNSSPASPSNSETVDNNASPPPQSEVTSIPKYPNLAAKEFPEVRDPNDIVGLQPKIPTIPTPLTSPSVPTATIPPLTSPLPLNQVQPLPPVNVSPVPNLQTLPQTQTNTEIKPTADGQYYIVMDNQGASSLAAARQVIPDAYLSTNQKLIYLGAMKTEEEAQQRLKQLQAKGIPARVYEP